jgi:hypothetical protein
LTLHIAKFLSQENLEITNLVLKGAKKNSFLALEVAVLECTFGKHAQGILGVK